MRAKLPSSAACLIVALLLTACGQTGPLYLPDEGVTTPVEIREAPTAPPADAAGAGPATPAPEKKEPVEEPDVPPVGPGT